MNPPIHQRVTFFRLRENASLPDAETFGAMPTSITRDQALVIDAAARRFHSGANIMAGNISRSSRCITQRGKQYRFIACPSTNSSTIVAQGHRIEKHSLSVDEMFLGSFSPRRTGGFNYAGSIRRKDSKAR